MLIFRTPYRCVSTLVLQGTVYLVCLTSTTCYTRYQDTAVYNNFKCCFIQKYFMYILTEDDPLGIETCCSQLFCINNCDKHNVHLFSY
jgi:hypothetical protein